MRLEKDHHVTPDVPRGEPLWPRLAFVVGLVESDLEDLRDAVTIDPELGILTRRALIGELLTAVQGSRRGGLILSVAFIDIDGFKGINDRHGHGVGDAALKVVAGSRIPAAHQSRSPSPMPWGLGIVAALLPVRLRRTRGGPGASQRPGLHAVP